ncbi:TIMELESS-interacting protein [Heterocephalus glaber]|uniref:TIMELESS-interacting protein n=1 Tax=Heterocephalus glaber TaxID=10181 RepID=G5AJT3_HETGA|nr:TIMELESS-interacting protein [Heterocephalus glaber]
MLEPQVDGLIDLPDYEHIEDETFPPFPPPAFPQREPSSEPDEESGSREPVPVPPKRTVKRNIPRLDAQRLISERGLPALRHVFDKTKFKAEGEKLDPEPRSTLMEEQQQRIERNKRLALGRRQAKLLSSSQAPENNMSMDTHGAQAVEEVHAGEEREEVNRHSPHPMR